MSLMTQPECHLGLPLGDQSTNLLSMALCACVCILIVCLQFAYRQCTDPSEFSVDIAETSRIRGLSFSGCISHLPPSISLIYSHLETLVGFSGHPGLFLLCAISGEISTT